MQCNNAGCMVELAVQLITVMVGTQVINDVVEIFLPCVLSHAHVDVGVVRRSLESW